LACVAAFACGAIRHIRLETTAPIKWLATWNGEPAPFIRKASADVIVDKVRSL